MHVHPLITAKTNRSYALLEAFSGKGQIHPASFLKINGSSFFYHQGAQRTFTKALKEVSKSNSRHFKLLTLGTFFVNHQGAQRVFTNALKVFILICRNKSRRDLTTIATGETCGIISCKKTTPKELNYSQYFSLKSIPCSIHKSINSCRNVLV